jgi:hypothetical protein
MALLEEDMRNMLGRGLCVVAMATLAAGLGASSAKAHHSDWGLPLVGGLVGGAGLTALYYHSQQQHQQAAPAAQVVQPVYVAPAATVVPAAAPAAPTATTIENQLNVLDQLAAKGYITPAEYQARRQALLDQL